MFVNSVRNNQVFSFKSNEAGAPDATVKKEDVAAHSAAAQKPEGDEFHKTTPSAADTAIPDNQTNGAMSFLSQINKMQQTQKILGGTLFGIGVLGALSFLSPKKWVRALFAIPVGGVMAYFGANMFNSAKALDKIKEITTAAENK